MALSKNHRLQGAAVVGSVMRTRPAASNELGALRIQRIPTPERRCSVVVSKKIAPLATARNRLRRKITEALAPLLIKTTKGWRGVLTLRLATLLSPAEIRKLLLELMEKSDIVQQ